METSAIVGTAAYKLNGAVIGYQPFSKIGDGNTCYYAVTDNIGNWEVGLGTYALSTTTLSRTTILASSNNSAIVSWPLSNAKFIWLDFPALLAEGLPSGNNVRIISTSGSITITTTDATVVMNLGSAGAVAAQLPTVASRNGLPLTAADFNGNGTMTLTPDASNAGGIQGQANWVISPYGNQQFTPNAVLNGWIVTA